MSLVCLRYYFTFIIFLSIFLVPSYCFISSIPLFISLIMLSFILSLFDLLYIKVRYCCNFNGLLYIFYYYTVIILTFIAFDMFYYTNLQSPKMKKKCFPLFMQYRVSKYIPEPHEHHVVFIFCIL